MEFLADALENSRARIRTACTYCEVLNAAAAPKIFHPSFISLRSELLDTDVRRPGSGGVIFVFSEANCEAG